MDFAHLTAFSSRLTNAVTLGLLLTALLLFVILLVLRLSKFIQLTVGPEFSPLRPDDLGPSAPGPKPWPVVGCLPLLAKFPSSWEAFVHLKSVYGDVFQIQLGNKLCLVVSSMDAIKEVLTKKAHIFNGRPNFIRYHTLFGGDRDRSLALCDWSDVQKVRRRLAIPYVFPRPTTDKFDQLESAIDFELTTYVDHLRARCEKGGCEKTPFDKLHCSQVVFNIFFSYFCSHRYSYEDGGFQQMIRNFDLIFKDMNSGFALDFLPWLLPSYLIHLTKLFYHGQCIRTFLLETLVQERADSLSDQHAPRDFLDAVLMHTSIHKGGKRRHLLTNSQALYEVEDILGGHSAVACFWARVLDQISRRPDVQRRIQEETEAVLASEASEDNVIRLSHRPAMPYTQAVILETLRVTTSPIVPHVATEESTVGGFRVPKDTMIFLNNYYVNTSDTFWKNPQDFDPSRFLDEAGRLFKPEYFLPFSTGIRSCLGYQLVQSISFLATVKLLQHFDIQPSEDSIGNNKINVNGTCGPLEKAKLAIEDDDVKASFIPRPLSTKIVTFSQSNDAGCMKHFISDAILDAPLL